MSYNEALKYENLNVDDLKTQIQLGIVYRQLDEYTKSSQLLLDVINDSDQEPALQLYASLHLIENYVETNQYDELEHLIEAVSLLLQSLEKTIETLSVEIIYQTYEVLLALHQNDIQTVTDHLTDIERLKNEREFMSPSSEELIFVYEEEAILVKRAYATYYREIGHLEKALNYYDELSDIATQTGDRYNYKLALNEKIEIYRAQGRDDLIADTYKVLYENEQDIKKTLQ